MTYPFDRDLWEYMARRLYDSLPALYKLDDERARHATPPQRGDLELFTSVLAVPLAVIRQSIEELYADLFIDSASDWVLPYLADMVGTTLVFPDPASNRRDIRGTVGWRQRKGTPAMLQDLGQELTGQLVVAQEGWQRLQMSQDLNMRRDARIVPRIQRPSLAEQVEGPLGRLHRSVDARAISATTGKYHPKQMVHWAHPTLMYPINGATPADLRDPATDPDLRFAFDPFGIEKPLRCRRIGSADRLETDRVPAMTFAEHPDAWFGRDGRFDVHICGLTAALADATAGPLAGERHAAEQALMTGAVEMRLLTMDGRAVSGPVWIEMHAVPVDATTGLPDTAATELRARLRINAAGVTAFEQPNVGAVAPGAIPMLRLIPDGAAGRRFPGAVVAIAGGTAAARLASSFPATAREGFLRGALVIKLPAVRIETERWFYPAADGSLFRAQTTGHGPVDVKPEPTGPTLSLPETARLTTGQGAAWPPRPASADFVLWPAVVAAPGAAPVVMHGGGSVTENAGAFAPAPSTETSALVFALTYFADGRRYEPMLRLLWTGGNPALASWQAIGADARAVRSGGTPVDAGTRFAALAAVAGRQPPDLGLAVRFEASAANARLAASEVAFTAADGRTVLIHLPDLPVAAANPDPTWPVGEAPVSHAIVALHASVALSVGRDGSTWRAGTNINARRALGAVAPIQTTSWLLRRRVRGRSLCQWRNENPPTLMHAETPPSFLDIDVAHGLFALNAGDGLPVRPADGSGIRGASLEVVYQGGYSAVIGARTEPREPLLDERLPAPTRIVSASGRLSASASPAWLALPRYRSLGAALADIALAPQSAEVIQFEDSATYVGEGIAWPPGVASLAVQAAEGERPVVDVAGSTIGAGAYTQLTITGIVLQFAAAGAVPLPPANSIRIRFVTVLRADVRFDLQLVAGNDRPHAVIDRAMLAGVAMASGGSLLIRDSVIDTGAGAGRAALDLPQADLTIERATVVGSVNALSVEASETIFLDPVTVADRFHGCVRYSRVTSNSVLPRRHRVAVDTVVDFVSKDRQNPAHARLGERCDPAVLQGAADGGEMGAFHQAQLAQRYRAFRQRLSEFTPAGLMFGIVRVD
jgi:hypothetical protein